MFEEDSIFSRIKDGLEISWQGFLVMGAISIVIWVLIGCAFFFTGTALLESAIGSALLLVLALFCSRTLLLGILIALMLKVGGTTLVALVGPWGLQEQLQATVGVLNAAAFPLTVLAITTLLFFFTSIRKYITGFWRI